MKEKTMGWLAILLAFASAESLLGHHSLTNFDTTKPIRVKGTVVRFHQVNPHSLVYLDQQDADGQTVRWAVEGPSVLELNRRRLAQDVLKPGDVVEVCGYLPKTATIRRTAGTGTIATTSGRLLNAETVVMPDGKEQRWGDYGAHGCFMPGYTDHHSK